MKIFKRRKNGNEGKKTTKKQKERKTKVFGKLKKKGKEREKRKFSNSIPKNKDFRKYFPFNSETILKL